MVSEVWRTLTKTQLRKYSLYEPQKFLWQRLTSRNFWDNDSSAEISQTTTHRQKFLRQGSTEISGTTVQRNFWDNDPQKFLGRLERINFWGPLMRSRLYFQFALRFQFPSANEKKKILFKTIYSSFFVICDRKQS